MTHSSVHIQIAEASVPSIPSWFGEVAIMELESSSGRRTAPLGFSHAFDGICSC